MLSKLLIKNYALIAEEEILFSEGFTVLTGETGAGKTLLVEALGLVLGKRADHSLLTVSTGKCIVEAEFLHVKKDWLDAVEDEFDMENETLILRREISPSGQSRAFINDTPVSLQTMRIVSARLVDLHGQHENQLLLSNESQLKVLDQFSGTGESARKFGILQREWLQIEKEISELKNAEAETKRQLDYFQFQLNDLDSIQLDSGEDENLENEIKMLEHAEEVREVISSSVDELYEGDVSIFGKLAAIISKVEKFANLKVELEANSTKLREVQNLLREISFELKDIGDSMDSDPKRLDELFSRQNALNKLKLRFSVRTMDELISMRDEFRSKVETFSNFDEKIADLEKKKKSLEKEMIALGLDLEKSREEGGKELAKKVKSLLKEVGLENSEFSVEIIRNESPEGKLEIEGKKLQPLSFGLNKISFLIRTNKGMPLSALSSTASGGEISRVMLALKSALAGKAGLPVMVFDEIDTGISGEVANKVGKVMQKLGNSLQVIAITHLPQIAGRGNRHLLVHKEANGKKPVTKVSEISGKERILEIAKMLSGEPPSKSAIKNAEEIIISGS